MAHKKFEEETKLRDMEFYQGFTIGLILVSLFFSLIAIYAYSDNVNINDLGTYMCEEKGLELESTKLSRYFTSLDFKIVCKEPNYEELEKTVVLIGEEVGTK